jgi:Tol biopolymer transport system component
MPNGRVVLYTLGDSILAYNLTTRRSTFLTRGWYWHLRISPAGNRVAFTGRNEAGDNLIMSMPINPQTGLATGLAQRVSLSLGDEPSFSPDGRFLAFGIRGPNRTQDLAIVPATGGPERILARYGEARIGETSWTSDGSSVIAQVSRDPARSKWTLERVPAAGGKSETVFPFTTGFPFSGYMIGSIDDGRIGFFIPGSFNLAERQGRVTYATVSGAHGEFLIPRGATLENNLSSTRAVAVVDTRPEWAHLVNLTDGNVRVLRPNSVSSRGPAWSPDGRKIALHDSTGGVYGITVINADGSGPRHYPVAAFPSYMRWAPDGRALAYSLEPKPGGPPEIGVLDLATGETRVVSSSPNASALDYRWRPDGKSLVVLKTFPGSGNGPLVRHVFHATVTNGERKLRDLNAEFPSMVNGGLFSDSVLGVGNAPNVEHLLVPTMGGPAVRLPPGRNWIREPGVSPDGKWLAAIVRDSDGRINSIDLVSAAGDSMRTLRLPFEAGPSIFRPPFTPDGRHLILFGKIPGETVSKIFSVPLDGSAPKALATLPTTSTVAGRLDLSPDGSAVVFTSVGPWTSRLYEIDVTPILQAIGKQ